MRGLEPCEEGSTPSTLTYMDLKEWLKPREVAELLRVSYVTIKRMENKGQLLPTKYIQRGRRRDRMYSRSDILDYLGIKE